MTRLFRLKFSFVHACRRRMRTHDVRYSLSSVRWLARPRPSTVIFLGADGYQSPPRSAYVKTVRSYFVCNEREKRETRNEKRDTPKTTQGYNNNYKNNNFLLLSRGSTYIPVASCRRFEKFCRRFATFKSRRHRLELGNQGLFPMRIPGNPPPMKWLVAASAASLLFTSKTE